jgi:DNA mismatch repair protein MutL
VRELFHNVPARLAATARPQVEVAQIVQTVRRLALAAPHVRLLLYLEGRLVFGATGSGDLATALGEAYGHGAAEALSALGPVEAGGARLRGVVAGPETTRPGRAQVNVVVNGRWAQPRGLLALLEKAYRPLLPRGRHPVLALVVETPPERVDINIHPSKLEVRLLEERAIGAAAGELVRGALARRPLELRQPFATGLDALVEHTTLGEARESYDEEGPILSPGLPPLRLVGQARDRLIMLEGEAGLYMVDQHRAHERVLYERLLAAHGGDGPEPVALPEPLLLELRPAQALRLARRLGELGRLGFHLEAFGGRAFLLRGAPELPGVLGGGREGLEGLGEPGELGEALFGLADEEAGDGEGWRERLLVSLACRTAVRRGKPLERGTMRALVAALGHTGAPAVCPHGSPLLMHVSGALLERGFRWG